MLVLLHVRSVPHQLGLSNYAFLQIPRRLSVPRTQQAPLHYPSTRSPRCWVYVFSRDAVVLLTTLQLPHVSQDKDHWVPLSHDPFLRTQLSRRLQ